MTAGFDFWRNKTAAWDAVGTYSTDFYMTEARRVLAAHDPAEPLFLYFAHQLSRCFQRSRQRPRGAMA
eukprot:gene6949-1914_t